MHILANDTWYLTVLTFGITQQNTHNSSIINSENIKSVEL